LLVRPAAGLHDLPMPTLLLRLARGHLARLPLVALALCGATHLPATAQALASGTHTLVHQDQQRRYLLRLPTTTAREARVPLVIVLHGGGGHPESAETGTGFTPKALAAGYAVAYPAGTGPMGDRLLTWNARHCCGRAMGQQVDDVGFIARLIDTLVARAGIDPARVYVTGASNGGMLAHRVGAELADRVAGIAPVIATVFGDETLPSRPVAMLAINGAIDRSVPMAGGSSGGRFADAWDGTAMRPVEAQGSFWARANGCEGGPRSENSAALQQWVYRCPAGAEVRLVIVTDSGHAWPGGRRSTRLADTPSTSLDATDTILAFFTRQASAKRP
jgi:polyhydroxybutyrate depolymerase